MFSLLVKVAQKTTGEWLTSRPITYGLTAYDFLVIEVFVGFCGVRPRSQRVSHGKKVEKSVAKHPSVTPGIMTSMSERAELQLEVCHVIISLREEDDDDDHR